MTSTIEKEGNLLPHNTTEEWEEIIRLSSLVGTDAKNPEERLIDAIKVKLFNTHNLALQQVLEKLPEIFEVLKKRDSKMYSYWKAVFEDDFEGGYDMHYDEDFNSQVKSIITSLQKE